MKKKFISVLLALMTASGAAVIPAAAAETEAVGAAADSEAVAAEIEDEAVSAASASAVKLSGTASFNFSAQDYSTWNKVMNSYLSEKSDGTLERVEYCPDNNMLIYEVYSADGKTKKKSGSISMELPLFGGFFSGSDCNYVVFGKSNPNNDDKSEVLRVVKYSKDWERQSSVSVYGANTKNPFEAGSLRMAEKNGKLYIHTCHKMYNGHQANMSYVITESDMKIAECNYNVLWFEKGYVSHSFNQFIQNDGTYLYRVDHGDAYPRAITLTKVSLSGSINTVSTCEPVSLANTGNTGYNYTGVSVGGFELSSDKCIIAFNGVDFTKANADPNGKRNIYLSITGKDLASSKNVKLTNYGSTSNINVSTPQLVKINNSRFLVMWEETDTSKMTMITKLASVSADGVVDSQGIVSTNYMLSDCQPILCKDGAVRWYASDADAATLYTVNPSAISQAASSTASSLNKEISVTLAIGDTYEVPKSVVSRSGWKSKGGSPSFFNCVDSNYVVTAKECCTGTLKFEMNYGGLITYKFTIVESLPKPGAPTLTLTNQTNGLKASWNSVSNAKSYTVYYRLTMGGEWSTVSTSSTSTLLKNIEPGMPYIVQVQSIGENNVKGDYSTTKTITYIPQVTPSITLKNTSNGIRVDWQTSSGAEKYTVYHKLTPASAWTSVRTSSNFYTLTDVTPGSNYSVKVQPIYNGSKGLASAVYSLTYVPQVKPDLTLANKTNGIRADWNKIDGATKYILYYKKSSDSAWSNREAINNFYTITEITPGEQYTIKVRPVFGSSNGVYSIAYNKVYVPQVKTTVTLSNKSNGIRADWTAVSGATKYVVSYKKASDSAWTSKETTNIYYMTTGLAAGTSYSFRVQPVFGSSNGVNSAEVKLTYIPQVKPVVTLSNKSNGIRAEWKEVAGATKYIVYYKQSDASAWSSTETKNLYYPLITNIEIGKSYSFQVKPVFGTVNGLYSTVAKLTYIPQVKPTVTLSNKSNGIRAEWGAVTGATKYIVYYKQTGETTWSSKETSNLYFALTGIKAGTNYSIQLQPVFGTLKGAYSTVKTLTYVPQIKPTVTLANKTNGIRISWNAISGATKYRVFYKKTGDSSWTSVQTSNCYYTYLNAVKGTNYSFQVQPIFDSTYGLYSTVSTITYK